MPTKTTAQKEAARQTILGWMADAMATRAAAEAQAELDRKAGAVLATMSPRRQWTTRYGATFVEGVGFTVLPGVA